MTPEKMHARIYLRISYYNSFLPVAQSRQQEEDSDSPPEQLVHLHDVGAADQQMEQKRLYMRRNYGQLRDYTKGQGRIKLV